MVAVMVVAAGVVVVVFRVPRLSAFLPPCPFHWATGLWCPGCGSGRAVRALLTGDILGAINYNPLMMASLPFLAYAAVSALRRSFLGKGLPRILPGRYWGWVVVFLVFAYWIARNIPVYPFTILAP